MTHGTTTTSPRDPLKALQPFLGSLKTGLAIFALYIIFRLCAVRIIAWLRQNRNPGQPIPAVAQPVLLSRQRLQQQQQQSNWIMDEKRPGKATNWQNNEHDGSFREPAPTEKKQLVVEPNWQASGFDSVGEAIPRPVMSRPPPAPPLTPPELSTAVFAFQDRPRGVVDDSFIHQPNPDYMSSTAADMSTSTAISPPSSASPTIPRRRSYNKTLPIGVPLAQPLSAELDAAEPTTFSPRSYPSTSPLLPPAPPGAQSNEIGVQGEIIGLLDGEGAGWTRHTRVYGGGVCLACAASGGNHGGGFYGATVRPEEMR